MFFSDYIDLYQNYIYNNHERCSIQKDDTMSNMREVAKLAGVSVSTVSAVINDNKNVSGELRRKIEAAIVQTGYRKPSVEEDDIGRTIAVILPGICSSFFSPLLNGICDIASEHNMSVMLLDSKRSIKAEAKLIQTCVRRGIRNIILDSVCDIPHEEEYFADIRENLIRRRGMRVAVVERKLADEAFFSIYVDNYNAAYEATSHLLDCGCRKLVHITGADEFPHTRIRENAFRAVLQERGIPFDEKLLLEGDFTPLSGFAAMRTLLDNGIAVDGVFASNDQMAIGAMKALIAGGRKIPGDCAVVGFDNLAMSSLVTPGLTTVHFPIYQLGYQAAYLLKERLNGKKPQPWVKLECRLVVRGSTRQGKTDDWDLLGW